MKKLKKKHKPEMLKIGNCMLCGKPINDEQHHRVGDKRNHTFMDPKPVPERL